MNELPDEIAELFTKPMGFPNSATEQELFVYRGALAVASMCQSCSSGNSRTDWRSDRFVFSITRQRIDLPWTFWSMDHAGSRGSPLVALPLWKIKASLRGPRHPRAHVMVKGCCAGAILRQCWWVTQSLEISQIQSSDR